MKSVLQIVFCLLTSIIIADIPVQALTANNFTYIVQNQNIAELPDLSRAVITLEDLPPGFEEKENSISKSQVLFSFLRENNISSQFILGITGLLDDRFEEALLKLNQEQWQRLLEKFIKSFSINHDEDFKKYFGRLFIILDSRDLTILNEIGEVSGGQSRLVKISGQPFRMDTVVFIRGRVMAYVLVLYLEDDVAAVSIIDLARKLDARIQQR